MDNIFYVDLENKKKLQKRFIKSNKSTTILSFGIWGILLIFSIIFAVYGLGMKNTFLVQDLTATNYGEKNFLLIWTILITVDVVILFLWFIQRIAVNGVLGKNNSQRVNESLIISQDVLEYGYQNSVGASSGDRVVVTIPLNKIEQIKINKMLGMIELRGCISSKYYENYAKKQTRAPKDNYKNGSFIVFDYFQPGLIEYFKNNYAGKVEVE